VPGPRVAGQQGVRPGQLRVTAGEGWHVGGQLGRARHRCAGRRRAGTVAAGPCGLLAQHLFVGGAQLGPGVDTQLIGEPRTHDPVGVQGLCLVSGRCEGEDQLGL
jgi:hypothetical protein